MTLIRKWSGDSLNAGSFTLASVGSGDTPFSSVSGGGTFAIAADGLHPPQLTWPETSAAHQLRWNALGDLSAWAIRRYFNITNLPGVTCGLLMGHTSTGSDLFRVEFNASGYIRYRSAIAAVYSPSTNPIIEGKVYRVEITGSSDGNSSIYLYEGDSTTAVLSASVMVTAGELDEVRFGHHSSVATVGETGDDFAIADTATLIGPVQTDWETGVWLPWTI